MKAVVVGTMVAGGILTVTYGAFTILEVMRNHAPEAAITGATTVLAAVYMGLGLKILRRIDEDSAK